jgi:hypothetical protein
LIGANHGKHSGSCGRALKFVIAICLAVMVLFPELVTVPTKWFGG